MSNGSEPWLNNSSCHEIDWLIVHVLPGRNPGLPWCWNREEVHGSIVFPRVPPENVSVFLLGNCSKHFVPLYTKRGVEG